MKHTIKLLKEEISATRLAMDSDGLNLEQRKKKISEMESELQQLEGMGWISVDERLPVIGEYVNFLIDGRFRRFDFNYEGDGVFYDNRYDKTYRLKASRVTHWQPRTALPTPPINPETK